MVLNMRKVFTYTQLILFKTVFRLVYYQVDVFLVFSTCLQHSLNISHPGRYSLPVLVNKCHNKLYLRCAKSSLSALHKCRPSISAPQRNSAALHTTQTSENCTPRDIRELYTETYQRIVYRDTSENCTPRHIRELYTEAYRRIVNPKTSENCTPRRIRELFTQKYHRLFTQRLQRIIYLETSENCPPRDINRDTLLDIITNILSKQIPIFCIDVTMASGTLYNTVYVFQVTP